MKILAVALVWVQTMGLPLAFAADPCADTSGGGQKATYCEAAKDAGKSATSAMAGMAVWGIVTGVCTTACASSAASFATMESVCMWSSLGGAVADIGITMMLAKDMSQSMSGLTGLLGAGMTAYMMQSGHSANLAASQLAQQNNAFIASKQQGPLQKPDVKRGAACMSAGMAAIQTVMKGVTMSQANKSKQDALASAASINDQNAAPAVVALDSSGFAVKSASAPLGVPGGGIAPPAADGGSGGGSSASGCGSQLKSGNTQAFLSCATADNPGLQKLVNDPNFEKAFKAGSGQSVGDYLKGISDGTSGAQAAGAAVAGLTNAGQVQAQLDGMQKEVAQRMDLASAGTYASRGGGGSGGSAGGSSEGDEFGKVMEKMMGQIMGPDGQAKKLDPELQKIEFANRGKDAANLAENRGISIFARVAYRYRKSQDRLDQGPWSAIYNRTMYAPTQRGIASQPENRQTN